jgi:hypothetical protein
MLLIVTIDASAQCAMCTAVADEAMRNGSAQGAGINKGCFISFCDTLSIGGYYWHLLVEKKAKGRGRRLTSCIYASFFIFLPKNNNNICHQLQL